MNLYDALKKYCACNVQEENDRQEMLRWLESGKNVYSREFPMHLTVSGWVVSKDRHRVLLAYHNIYQSWSWLGGHADGETDSLKTAVKEVMEESGLKHVKPVSEDIFSLEILPVSGHVKKGVYVPSHLHMNITYLLEADECEEVQIKEDENSNVGWFDAEEVLSVSDEPWMAERIYKKLIKKVKEVK